MWNSLILQANDKGVNNLITYARELESTFASNKWNMEALVYSSKLKLEVQNIGIFYSIVSFLTLIDEKKNSVHLWCLIEWLK